MPISEKQLQANRANAQLSTGPKSPEGKARVAANRLSHGLAGRHIILPGESHEDYAELLASLIADLAPASAVEDILVHQVAESHWKLRRIDRYEAELLARYPNPFLDDEGARRHGQLSRYQAATRRALRQALDELRRHRAAARAHQNHQLAASLDTALEPENPACRSNPLTAQPPPDQPPTPPPPSSPGCGDNIVSHDNHDPHHP